MIRIAEARLRAFARVERRGGSRKRFADRPEFPAMLEEIERAAETGVVGGAQQARETDALIGFASSLAADAPPLMQNEPHQIANLLTIGLHQNLSGSVRAVPFFE
jgi:hypothetical protein